MTSNKSEPVKDKIWDQHLKWLDLVSNECKSNQLKRERANCREEPRGQKPEAKPRPSA